MATTVSQAFDEFLSNLIPSKTETDAAKGHSQSVQDALAAALRLDYFFPSGSTGNGTSVRSFSDVDYFAGIGADDVPASSASLLGKVRDILQARFSATEVCVRTPAVSVRFAGGKETLEVVPAQHVGQTAEGQNKYKIADGSGGWIITSPKAHNAYVSAQNERLSKKVKPLIRFLKAWKYQRNVHIISFYLEMRTAKYASNESTIFYPFDVKGVFRDLANAKLAAMQDPVGISGLIQPGTEAQVQDALCKLDTARARADKALEADKTGKTAEAIEEWGKVFGAGFPSYG